jgi:hypothetical protein
VKPLSADGSLGSPHARVGHCQALNSKNPNIQKSVGIFFCLEIMFLFIIYFVKSQTLLINALQNSKRTTKFTPAVDDCWGIFFVCKVVFYYNK